MASLWETQERAMRPGTQCHHPRAATHAHSGRVSRTPTPQASCVALLLCYQSLTGRGVRMRVYSTALETPWPPLEACMTPIRGLARQAPLLRHSPRRSQHELARQVGWRAGRMRHGETSTRTTVPLALVALARGLAIAADALRGLAVTVRPQRRRA